MRGFFCTLLSILLLAGSVPVMAEETALPPAPQTEELPLYAGAAVLMDADSGRVLYGKNETAPMAMASTTKIMTCILVLENAECDEVAEVSAYAASMPKVKLYVKCGEQYTVRELLFSLMLESHNDAAAVLAEYIGAKSVGETGGAATRTVEESRERIRRFAVLMNAKAEEIGCEDTWFITPNGLDATETLTAPDGTKEEREHHTTAVDLARVLRYCILESPKRDLFREITGTAEYCFTENGRSFSCHNHNAFLQMMDGAFTGKTGFTNKAGYCYVGALERDNRRLIVVLLACGWPNHKTYKWSDTRNLMEYGLEHFSWRPFREKALPDAVATAPIAVPGATNTRLGEDRSIPVVWEAGSDVDGMLMLASEKVEVTCERAPYLEAPVRKGDWIGEIRYSVNDVIVRREPLLAGEDAEAISYGWCIVQIVQRYGIHMEK